MAEQIGNIDVDYRSPKITDDLTQQTAGLRATEQENLGSQIYSRNLSAQMGAANTASTITARSAQTSLAERKYESDADLANRKHDVEADYKYNLINMNRRESERKDAKLPLELAGMEARNWIDQTVAQNNKLKNELLDETMADQIEQQRLQTLTDSSNLQQNRIGTEVARRAVESEKKYLPAYNDFWAGVEDKSVDPETATRPSYGGNVKLNELHDQRMREWRGSNAFNTERETQSRDAVHASNRLAALTPAQRAAYNNAANPAAAAVVMQAATQTNDTFERLTQAHPTASAAVIDSLRRDIHPVTNVAGGTAAIPAVVGTLAVPAVTGPMGSVISPAIPAVAAIPAIPATPRLVDADGNLTPAGRTVAAQEMQALAAQQRQDARYVATAGTRTAVTGQHVFHFASEALRAGVTVDTRYNRATSQYEFADPTQVTAAYNAIHQVSLNAAQAQAAISNNNDRQRFVRDMTTALTGTPTASDPDVDHTPTTALATANTMANTQFGPAAAGGAAGGGANPVNTVVNTAQLTGDDLRTARQSRAVLHSLTNWITTQHGDSDGDTTDARLGIGPDGRVRELAWHENEDIDIEEAGEGWWAEDWDMEGAEYAPRIEGSSPLTTDDYDNPQEAIDEFIGRMGNAGVQQQQLFDYVRPHPAHMRAFGMQVPKINVINGQSVPPDAYTWVYVSRGRTGSPQRSMQQHGRWRAVLAVDTNGNRLTKQKIIANGNLGQYGTSVWVGGIDFDATSGKPTNQ